MLAFAGRSSTAMKFTDIQPASILAVLLVDGWHYVAAGTSLEFVHPSVTEPKPEWFRFTEQLPASPHHAGERAIIAGPLSSILAFRLMELPSG